MLLNGTLEAAAAGRTPRVLILGEFDWPDGMGRYILGGYGDRVIDGETWTGDAGLTTVSAVAFGLDDSADMVEFGLSAVDPTLLPLAAEAGSVRGRSCSIYMQFFDEDGAPLDAKVLLRMLVMDTITYSGAGPSQRALKLNAESIWIARNTARFAFYADRDQQGRFAGDPGCEFVPGPRTRLVTWPFYEAA